MKKTPATCLFILTVILLGNAVPVKAEIPVISRENTERTELKLEFPGFRPDEAGRKPATPEKQNKGYLIFGGSFGLSFGDYTNVNIAPQVGYRFNRYFAAGGGFSYNYFHDRDWDYDLNYLGAHLFARFYPVRYIVAFVQPEIQRRWGSLRGRPSSNEVFGSLLLGGGVVIPIGGRGGMSLTVHYDVIQNRYTPYGSNIGYSVGYTFGF